MASDILSRFLPATTGEPSIYETLRQHDESSEHSDIEERAGMAIDEDNLEAPFHDYDLNDDFDDAAVESSVTPQRTKAPFQRREGLPPKTAKHMGQASKAAKRATAEDVDDEVPQSLLIEGDDDGAPKARRQQDTGIPPPISGPSTRGTHAKWQTTQQHQRLHEDLTPRHAPIPPIARRGHPLGMMDPKQKAEWMWANVENLDNFLKQVYEYYLGHGIWSIMLNRVLFLL